MQLLPTGVHVSVAYPPDTDTPGYANENTTKVCITPGTSTLLWHVVFAIRRHPFAMGTINFYLVIV